MAIVTSDGTLKIAEEAGGKESVIVPMLDCTISVYVSFVNAIFPVTSTSTYTTNCDGRKHEKNPEIWVLYEACHGYFIGFLNSNYVNLFIAFPRTRQEAGSFIDDFFRSFIHCLQYRIAVGNGERTCTK